MVQTKCPLGKFSRCVAQQITGMFESERERKKQEEERAVVVQCVRYARSGGGLGLTGQRKRDLVFWLWSAWVSLDMLFGRVGLAGGPSHFGRGIAGGNHTVHHETRCQLRRHGM